MVMRLESAEIAQCMFFVIFEEPRVFAATALVSKMGQC
jgi:hypothetical protein